MAPENLNDLPSSSPESSGESKLLGDDSFNSTEPVPENPVEPHDPIDDVSNILPDNNDPEESFPYATSDTTPSDFSNPGVEKTININSKELAPTRKAYSEAMAKSASYAGNFDKTSQSHGAPDWAFLLGSDYDIANILTRQPPDKYDLVSGVGHGGMKIIFKVKDKDTSRFVALAKLQRKEKAESMAPRFVQEARITANLEHPNIVPVHDIGVDKENNPYFTMKLIKGRNLARIITQLRRNKDKYTKEYGLPHLIEIFLKVCDAVAFAHSKGIIHLDLKPENIQVGDFGEVLVLDWGLARVVEDEKRGDSEGMMDFNPDATVRKHLVDSKVGITLDGVVKGTPGYMAPEQAEGKNRDKDHRTDIYALGAILYSILTWELPIEGENPFKILRKTMNGDIIPPKKRAPKRIIPSALEGVVLKSMALDPKERYQSVPELRRDINAFTGGFATSAEQSSIIAQVILLIKRHKTETVLLSICFAIILLLYWKTKEIETKALREQVKAEVELLDKNNYCRQAAPDFLAKGRRFMYLNNWQSALNIFDFALKLDPHLYQVWFEKGRVYMVGFNFDQAMFCFNKFDSPQTEKLRVLADKYQNYKDEDGESISINQKRELISDLLTIKENLIANAISKKLERQLKKVRQ